METSEDIRKSKQITILKNLVEEIQTSINIKNDEMDLISMCFKNGNEL